MAIQERYSRERYLEECFKELKELYPQEL